MKCSPELHAKACVGYFSSPSSKSREAFFRCALAFSREQARKHVYFSAHGFCDREVLIEEVVSEAMEFLVLEVAKPYFHAQAWIDNPIGCLKTFVYHRAISFFRREGLYQFRNLNSWSFDGPKSVA